MRYYQLNQLIKRKVILYGKSEKLFVECIGHSRGRIKFLKNAVSKVAIKNDVDVGLLANYVAHRMSNLGQNWCGAANNLQFNEDPFTVAYQTMNNRLDSSKINVLEDPIEQEIVQNAIFEV